MSGLSGYFCSLSSRDLFTLSLHKLRRKKGRERLRRGRFVRGGREVSQSVLKGTGTNPDNQDAHGLEEPRHQPRRNPDTSGRTPTSRLQRDALVREQPLAVGPRGSVLYDRGDEVLQPPEEHVAWRGDHALALGELLERGVQVVLPR